MIDSPHEIEARMQELDERLDRIVTETEARAKTQAEADADYHDAYHQAVLKIRDAERGKPRSERSTVDEVEARAAIQCQAEYRAKGFADALFKSVQTAGRVRQSQMDAQRSLYAGVRRLVDA